LVRKTAVLQRPQPVARPVLQVAGDVDHRLLTGKKQDPILGPQPQRTRTRIGRPDA